MELRHLRYFVAVAEELNFTHAAARLRVAQPALSRQIKDLEHELDTPLFDRNRSGVQLTRGGKALFQRAKAILRQAGEAAAEARAAAGSATGSLVIGYPSGLHLSHLGPVIQDLRREQPKVDLDFVYGLQSQQIKGVREKTLDIGFVTASGPLAGLDQQIVWRVPFKVVLPQRHPLARRAHFQLGDLRNEDFVFCTRESRSAFYDEFFRQCANAGFYPKVVKEVGGYPTNMLGLVSIGAGLSVLPYFERVERVPGLVWRPLIKPRFWAEFALIWRREDPSLLVQRFIAGSAKRFAAVEGSLPGY